MVDCGGGPSWSGWGPATPTSTTVTVAATTRASALIAAPPAAMVATMAAVISWGHALAPSATTPWSAANTTTAGRWGTAGGHRPVTPARCTARSSSAPSDPGGLARDDQRSRAALMAASSSVGLASLLTAPFTVSSIAVVGTGEGPEGEHRGRWLTQEPVQYQPDGCCPAARSD